jgi:hypothetical protein
MLLGGAQLTPASNACLKQSRVAASSSESPFDLVGLACPEIYSADNFWHPF